MKYFLILFCSFFIFSCSRVKLVYTFAPKVITDKLDDGFNFKSDRYREVRNQIENDFKNNKKEVAQHVIEFIDVALVLAEKDKISEQEFEILFKQVRMKQQILVLLFKPSFQKVILNTTEAEIKHLLIFAENKASKNDEMIKKKYPYIEKKLDDFEKIMSYFFGFSNDMQKNIYRSFIEENLPYFKAQAAAKRDFINQFPVANKVDMSDYALKYYSGDKTIRTRGYVQQFDIFEKNLIHLMHELWLTVDKNQKGFLKTKLLTLKADLKKMAEEN